MHANTRIAARIVGPLLLIIGAVIIARFADMGLLIPAIVQDGPLVFVTGVFTLICGLTLFAFHHQWKGAAAFVISLLAVLTIVRGIILMFAPRLVANLATSFFYLMPGALIAGIIPLLLGAWLTFVGWFAKASA